MNLSDYQILNVIKTYIRNMRGRAESNGEGQETTAYPDSADSKEESMKRIVFERIEGIVTEKIKKHETP